MGACLTRSQQENFADKAQRSVSELSICLDTSFGDVKKTYFSLDDSGKVSPLSPSAFCSKPTSPSTTWSMQYDPKNDRWSVINNGDTAQVHMMREDSPLTNLRFNDMGFDDVEVFGLDETKPIRHWVDEDEEFSWGHKNTMHIHDDINAEPYGSPSFGYGLGGSTPSSISSCSIDVSIDMDNLIPVLVLGDTPRAGGAPIESDMGFPVDDSPPVSNMPPRIRDISSMSSSRHLRKLHADLTNDSIASNVFTTFECFANYRDRLVRMKTISADSPARVASVVHKAEELFSKCRFALKDIEQSEYQYIWPELSRLRQTINQWKCELAEMPESAL